MTANKGEKKIVREIQAQTGVSYLTCLQHLRSMRPLIDAEKVRLAQPLIAGDVSQRAPAWADIAIRLVVAALRKGSKSDED